MYQLEFTSETAKCRWWIFDRKKIMHSLNRNIFYTLAKPHKHPFRVCRIFYKAIIAALLVIQVIVSLTPKMVAILRSLSLLLLI